jgi:hypothetical protein
MPMDYPSQEEQILMVFKALADASRLKIIGLLAQQPYTVEQLASLLDLRPSTVSHHLARLAEVGLVSARAESYYNFYSLEQSALDNAARTLLAHKGLPNVVGGLDMDAYDRKVLHDFSLPDGHLKAIPAQRKKREIVLRHIVKDFEPGKHYKEREVVEILEHFHADTATLRRELIGYGMLVRQSGEYWRPIPTEGEKE